MHATQIFRNVLLPASALVAESKMKSQEEDECLCRPSELPIYVTERVQKSAANQSEETPSSLENAIRKTRQTFTKYSDEFNAYKRVGLDHLERSKENVDWVVDYLREEDNMLPKAGAISIGALTGLIFGLRGGFFKKTLYATTGGLGMAAICYPKEATEYSKVGLTEAKKYVTIAYNFAYGDKEEKSSEKVINDEDNSANIKDPLEIITETRDAALSKSCHCPIGACLGHEVNPPQTDPTLPSS